MKFQSFYHQLLSFADQRLLFLNNEAPKKAESVASKTELIKPIDTKADALSKAEQAIDSQSKQIQKTIDQRYEADLNFVTKAGGGLGGEGLKLVKEMMNQHRLSQQEAVFRVAEKYRRDIRMMKAIENNKPVLQLYQLAINELPKKASRYDKHALLKRFFEMAKSPKISPEDQKKLEMDKHEAANTLFITKVAGGVKGEGLQLVKQMMDQHRLTHYEAVRRVAEKYRKDLAMQQHIKSRPNVQKLYEKAMAQLPAKASRYDKHELLKKYADIESAPQLKGSAAVNIKLDKFTFINMNTDELKESGRDCSKLPLELESEAIHNLVHINRILINLVKDKKIPFDEASIRIIIQQPSKNNLVGTAEYLFSLLSEKSPNVTDDFLIEHPQARKCYELAKNGLAKLSPKHRYQAMMYLVGVANNYTSSAPVLKKYPRQLAILITQPHLFQNFFKNFANLKGAREGGEVNAETTKRYFLEYATIAEGKNTAKMRGSLNVALMLNESKFEAKPIAELYKSYHDCLALDERFQESAVHNLANITKALAKKTKEAGISFDEKNVEAIAKQPIKNNLIGTCEYLMALLNEKIPSAYEFANDHPKVRQSYLLDKDRLTKLAPADRYQAMMGYIGVAKGFRPDAKLLQKYPTELADLLTSPKALSAYSKRLAENKQDKSFDQKKLFLSYANMAHSGVDEYQLKESIRDQYSQEFYDESIANKENKLKPTDRNWILQQVDARFKGQSPDHKIAENYPRMMGMLMNNVPVAKDYTKALQSLTKQGKATNKTMLKLASDYFMKAANLKGSFNPLIEISYDTLFTKTTTKQLYTTFQDALKIGDYNSNTAIRTNLKNIKSVLLHTLFGGDSIKENQFTSQFKEEDEKSNVIKIIEATYQSLKKQPSSTIIASNSGQKNKPS